MITITITRSQILHIVEGISATIGQHNNGGATAWQALWASASESPKLDIWWREAIADLELAVNKWAQSTSSQFNLLQDGSDYTITLDPGERWSSKLSGLLANKIQSFMVHYVVSGWLSDFKDVQSPDYQEMATQDIKDIAYILVRRNLNTEASARHEDAQTKENTSDVASGACRDKDDEYFDEAPLYTAGARRDKDDICKAVCVENPFNGRQGIGTMSKPRHHHGL